MFRVMVSANFSMGPNVWRLILPTGSFPRPVSNRKPQKSFPASLAIDSSARQEENLNQAAAVHGAGNVSKAKT
jgi:hypothetical protein